MGLHSLTGCHCGRLTLQPIACMREQQITTASATKHTCPVKLNVLGQDNTAQEILLDLPQLDLHQPLPLTLTVTQHTPLLSHHSFLGQHSLPLPQVDLHQPLPLTLTVTQHTPLLSHHSFLGQHSLPLRQDIWMRVTPGTVIWTAFYPMNVMKIQKVSYRVYPAEDHSPPGSSIPLFQNISRRYLMILMHPTVQATHPRTSLACTNIRQKTLQDVDKQS